MAPAASLRLGRRRRRRRFVILPQVIKRSEDPGDGQNGDGVGPYPAHAEPISRAPGGEPGWFRSVRAAEGAAAPVGDGLNLQS